MSHSPAHDLICIWLCGLERLLWSAYARQKKLQGRPGRVTHLERQLIGDSNQCAAGVRASTVAHCQRDRESPDWQSVGPICGGPGAHGHGKGPAAARRAAPVNCSKQLGRGVVRSTGCGGWERQCGYTHGLGLHTGDFQQ